jgi:hypothetical protein
VVEERSRRDVLEAFERVAPAYTDQWVPAPGSGDPGWAVTELFSEMVTDVVTRLNRVPEKHRVGFYDALGFGRHPPQPARAPVTVTLAEATGENVRIPAGTQVAATPADGLPEQVFEFTPGEGFEATPASVHRVYSVDPAVDGIFEHGAALSAGAPTQLFAGDSLQRHALFVGHADLFDVPGGTTVRLDVTATGLAVLDHLRWEYYEERDDAAEDTGPDANWHRFDTDDVAVDRDASPATVSLTFPTQARDPAFEALTEATVGGIENRWVRGVVEPGVAAETFEALEIDALTVGLESRTAAIDALLVDGGPVDVPAGGSPVVQPFGLTPRPRDAFYIGCREAFTKRDTTVTLTLGGMTVSDLPPASVGSLDPPAVAWEYWNGESWTLIEGLRASSRTAADLRSTGGVTESISFPVPTNLEPTTVFGTDGYWIRARLREGRYYQETYRKDTSTEFGGSEHWTLVTKGVGVPSFTGVEIEYGGAEVGQEAEALASLNNLDYRVESTAGGISPFRRLPDERQTVYLGFDGPLVDGPLHLFVSPVDREYPETFSPRLRWEYNVGNGETKATGGAETWTRTEVRDETADLTRRGLVRLVFPERSVAHERFDEELHWLRARVTDPDGSFRRTPATTGTPSTSDTTSASTWSGVETATDGDCHCGGRPCCDDSCEGDDRLRTEPPAGDPSRAPPTLHRLVLNTGWGRNVRSVADETLGDSDGTPNQRFVVNTTPVLDETVWVDEGETLARAEREALEARGAVEEVTGTDGSPRAARVRWTAVPDFLASGPEDRHYTLDRLTGTLRFGDGVDGAIPPRGVGNVAISYQTGGGAAGNVAADTIVELKSDLGQVDGVTNPEAADGGADAESLPEVLDRAPAELRDRGRAVAPADVERVALDASRIVTRARCLPRTDDAGDRRLGWVTVVVVPRTDDDRPTPSVELRRVVDDALSEQAPATLVAPSDRLFVRGPSYVTASVTASVVAVATTASVSAVETTATDVVASFLHPLTGGAAESGWSFGELPCLSDVYALLESVDDVDHVADVTLTFRAVSTGDTAVVGDGSAPPTVGPDVLVSSGRHAISVELSGQSPTGGEP